MARGRLFESYNFRNKDPVIDEMRTAFQDKGFMSREGYKKVEANGAATASTYRAWFDGKTRRPQFATVRATARALGMDYKLVEVRKPRRKKK